MLGKRLVTAVILIPLVILALFYLSDTYFSMVVGIVCSLVALELADLIRLQLVWQKLLYVVVLWLFFAVVHWLPAMIFLWVAVFFWILALGYVCRYPNVGQRMRQSIAMRAIYGAMIIVPCWQALFILHHLSAYNVLFLLLIVWASDTGAYFAGRYFGHYKLAPNVSPNKTVEGLLGGVVAAVVVALIFTMFMHIDLVSWLSWLGLAVITALFAVIGDLFESMLKRIANVKDSGRLLPGHGGVFDRVDGILAAAPVFAIGTVIIGLFA